MSRNISDNGLQFKKAWEKFRGTAYKATKNEKYWTIGWGHTGPDVYEGQKITEGQGLLLLNRDMRWAVKGRAPLSLVLRSDGGARGISGLPSAQEQGLLCSPPKFLSPCRSHARSAEEALPSTFEGF